jgi:outer membrane protein
MKASIRTSLLSLALLAGPASADDLMTVWNLAAEQDPGLRAALAGLQSTRESLPQARADLLPTISASADSTYITRGGYNSNGYSLSLTQPVIDFTLLPTMRQAKADIAAGDADYESQRQQLMVDVAAAYLDVLAAQDSLEFSRANKSAIARQLEQATKRYEVGLIAITDVHEARARHDLAVADEIAAENVLSSAQEALREITGRYHEVLSTLRDETPLIPPDPQDLDSWTAAALEQNPDIISARYSSESAREEIAIQRAGHMPTLDLVGSHSRVDRQKGSTAGITENESVALQLTVPIYQGGKVSSKTRAAHHSFAQAQETLEETRRSVLKKTRDAYRGVLSGISRVKALKQALVSNQSALEATEAGFEVGTRTIVDVLDAQRNLYAAERDYKRARYDYLLNTLKLKQAAGTLRVDDLRAINGWLE